MSEGLSLQKYCQWFPQTMTIHHDRHHQTYVTGLNTALAKEPAVAGRSLEDMLRNLGTVPEGIFTHRIMVPFGLKGALTVTTVLGTFLADPQSYISGAKQLIVEPVLAPIARNTNWTWIIAGVLVVVLLAFIARTVALARTATRRRGHARP